MIELTGSSDSNILKFKPQPKTGDAKWKDIEDLINRWAKKQPQRAYELEMTLREARQEVADPEFAKMNNNAMADGRLQLILDPGLEEYIKVFYPKFLETKTELHEFMRRFPKFRIPERV